MKTNFVLIILIRGTKRAHTFKDSYLQFGEIFSNQLCSINKTYSIHWLDRPLQIKGIRGPSKT